VSAPLLLERIARRLSEDEGGCLVWTGPLTSNGYARVTWQGRSVFLHRLVMHLHGECTINLYDRTQLQVDHLCRNRACARREHLEMVTPQTNTLRGQSIQARNAQKTECAQSHPYDAENTGRRADGSRDCLACDRQLRREITAAIAAAALTLGVSTRTYRKQYGDSLHLARRIIKERAA